MDKTHQKKDRGLNIPAVLTVLSDVLKKHYLGRRVAVAVERGVG